MNKKKIEKRNSGLGQRELKRSGAGVTRIRCGQRRTREQRCP